MVTPIKLIEMLKIIDNRAKFMGIKLTMMKNLLEKYKDDKELLKEVLKLTEGTRLHDLILEAYPPLEELEKELKEEEFKSSIIVSKTEPISKEKKEQFYFTGAPPLVVYIKDYLRKFYFGSNIKKIFYDLGKNYALFLNLKNYDEMKEFMKKEFGEVTIEMSEPLMITVKNNKEALNYRSNEPVCYITAGFLAGCLENIADRKYIVEVVEEKCISVGDPYCVFIVKKTRVV
ncbi:V4R domain-containing protein [Methanocaldococcus indicus]|uniref:V4R domain-containing protein n=1 Tax=Methanocaldococcus indicus TaxID=213231 RepID=UPI003C6D1217